MRDFKNYFSISIVIIILQLIVMFILINNINNLNAEVIKKDKTIRINENYTKVINHYADSLETICNKNDIRNAIFNYDYNKDSLKIRKK